MRQWKRILSHASWDAAKTVVICGLVFCVGVFSLIGFVRGANPSEIHISPASQTVNASESFMVTVDCLPDQPVKAFELKIRFNPSLLQATSVSQGDFFSDYETTFFNPGVIDNVAGTIVNIYDLIVGPGNVTTPGSFLIINFTARSTSGASSVSLYDVRVTNETDYIPITVSSGSVTVVGGSSPPPPNPPPSGGENTPPSTPIKPLGPTLLELGTSYMYSSAAVDPDGDQVRLRFDWGDGLLSNWTSFVESNTSVSVWHNWEVISNYSIRVIAQDTNGSNSSWSDPLIVQISLEEGVLPPVSVFQVPIDGVVNQSLVFDASDSYDPDGMIVSYDWEFGDGTTEVGDVVTHTYQHPGEYTVTLTVTDNTGLTSTISQLFTIAADAGLSEDTFPLSLILSLFFIVAAIVLCVLLVYRYRTRGVILPTQRTQSKGKAVYPETRKASLQKQVEQYKRKAAPINVGVASLQTPGGKSTGTIADVDTRTTSLQKQIEQSKHRLSQINRNMADIDLVLNDIFVEMRRRKQAPQTNKILDAYSDLIVGQVEKDATTPLPPLSIKQVEELVNRRVHARVAENVDKM